MYDRILVATDGSELSAQAVNSALALGKLCAAKVIALNVVPRYPRSYLEGNAALDAAEVERTEARWTAQAQELLDHVKAEGQTLAVDVQTVAIKSDMVAEAIISTATEHKADLIVMASHGRKGIKRLLLGSETQHVLTHSHIPVLVLR